MSTERIVRQYVDKVASIDLEEYPRWDLEASLPNLPVPELSSTLKKYLLCIKPLVPKEQYENTRRIVEEFGKEGGQGEVVQQKLREYAETENNWVLNFWMDDMYMKVHLPLPVNSNPGMVFPRQYFEDQNAQLRFAARLISGILDYKVIIDSRSLPIDRARHREKGQPLCMEQYYRLFSSYRVPGVQKDCLVSPASSVMQEPEHIIVVCKNQFFMLDVVLNFARLSIDDLYTQLVRIVKQAEYEEEESRDEMIGILTAAERDRWAKARMKLMEDSTNRDSLDMIERCIFVLNLDQAMPISFNHQCSVDETNANMRDEVSLALQMIHGHGYKRNSANRWFDKTMQFVIGEDGACGLCYEHSPSEGIAVVQLIEHLLKYMEEVRRRKLPRMQSVCELAIPRKLRWKLTPDITDDIHHACQSLDRLISTMDLYVLRFAKFGKNFPKSQNMSPDAFIQLALQLTYYKVHKKLVSTYESASIRRFRLGRVDNIRACTCEALDWAKAVVGETVATDEEKVLLLRRAMKRQTEILVDAILGYGIDNHLLGLRQVCEEILEIDMPEIFTDESYKMSNHFTLSTSQVPTTMDAFMCYGPVVIDGYGACYNPHEDYMLMCISSFSNCEATRSDHFAFILEDSLLQMHELCLKGGGKSPQPPRKAAQNGTTASDGNLKEPNLRKPLPKQKDNVVEDENQNVSQVPR